MKERLYYILMNILEKLEQSINVERITDNEIDTLFGSASGTGTDAQDYVVEHGTSGIWKYRKWASGVSECWGTNSVVAVIRTAWGNIWQTSPNNIGGDTYPPNLFTSAPKVWMNVDWLDAACIPFTATLGTATAAPSYGAIRGTQSATAGVSVRYHIHAIGTWK